MLRCDGKDKITLWKFKFLKYLSLQGCHGSPSQISHNFAATNWRYTLITTSNYSKVVTTCHDIYHGIIMLKILSWQETNLLGNDGSH